ncbi:hypothetical protein QR692_10260 [Lactococcus petauri]|uniref:hypothetical protein n=1 Tax=Lactococcus petauri TaxID=1940789 RepID=UPI002078E19E|nr:hypothetical protein [Lactococcus petauri]USI65366.1 hypothetical protein LMK05_11145 [Lactococcus petauri]USI67861.1 hypothetical protein LMK04_10380 [Lactococcus petauri]WJE12522.1 hypothetical protein QR692_10260 [Lactococcus petauri]
MNKIKCPICHEKSAFLRYNQNRIYSCQCQSKACGEVVSLTTSSESKAIEILKSFEHVERVSCLQIPKHLAQNLLKYKGRLESKEDIEDFHFCVYGCYEGEAYTSFDTIKAYVNPATRDLVQVDEGA